jgi:hypothetical protein
MAALTKMTLVAMALLVPGGLVILAAYFLARAVRQEYRLDQAHAGLSRARHAMARIRFRDVWREARATF